jgi:hypothetical protein
MTIWVVLEHGTIPQSLAGGRGSGKSIAVPLFKLDVGALALGLKPLGGFAPDFYAGQVFEDVREDREGPGDGLRVGFPGCDPGPWFDPAEGLGTLHGLIRHIERSEHSARALAGTLEAFREMAGVLEHAKELGTRFQLGYDRSGAEAGYAIEES